MNLDVRDFEVWLREAQRKDIHEKIHALRMSRMAWAEGDAVKEEMSMYQNALSELDGTKAIRIKTAWEEMKSKGKG